MNDQKLYGKLVGYIQDCHAMEQNILRMLDSMIATTQDAETIQRLKEHHQETQRHEQLLRNRLNELGEGRSFISETAAAVGAMVKGVSDSMRCDKAGKNARDVYITEQTEIASYQLLERLAERAGDLATVKMAQQIRRDEEAMAKWITDRWDKFVDQTLTEEGITATRPAEEVMTPQEVAAEIPSKPITLAAPPTHGASHQSPSHRTRRIPVRTKADAPKRRRTIAK